MRSAVGPPDLSLIAVQIVLYSLYYYLGALHIKGSSAFYNKIR